MNTKKDWLVRILIGGALGLACWLLLSWLTQPGWLFGGGLGFDFTFYYGSLLPQAVGGVLSGALWAAFGAQCAVATLPFAEEGRALAARSLLHFAAMALTVALWVFLNCFNTDYPMNFFRYELWDFLVPFALIYALIWLGRWVGWYVEAAAIRAKLGLAPEPSPLKWRETLPHLGFAVLLCVVLPLVLRVLDAPDVPVLCGLLLPYVLLPVGGFFSALSLGRRQGFCPLYPLACAVLYLPTVFLLMNYTALFHCLMVAVPALAGDLLGAGLRRARERRADVER